MAPNGRVMVWIHGGGFTHGAGYEPLYNGGPLAVRGDVVVVTINYRLGALGLLHLPEIGRARQPGAARPGDGAHLGCATILPPSAAIWPRVTIFGEEARALRPWACLLAMPPARGLFRRAVQQSGIGRAAAPEMAGRIADAMLDLLGLDRARAKGIADDRARKKILQGAGRDRCKNLAPTCASVP